MAPTARGVLSALCLIAGAFTPTAATRARSRAGSALRSAAPAAESPNRTAGFGAAANRTSNDSSQAPLAANAIAHGETNNSMVGASSPLALSLQNASAITVVKPKHKLRICNAYPDSEAIDVFHGDSRLNDAPMEYKDCREFASPMQVGDKLKFAVDGVRAGHFAVSDLPEGDAVLVLVVFRRDTMSKAVAFESHVFANLINAQIAVLDAYKGPAGAGTTPAIRDSTGTKPGGGRVEALHYDSVVAVNPGIYEVVLQGPDGHVKTKEELVALNRESYIVVRCGVEPRVGQGYPQELIVFPHSNPKVLTGSGSGTVKGISLLVSAVAMLAALAASA